MEFLKRYWTQIQAQLEGLSASQRWLIGVALALGLVLTGLVVVLAARPQMVPISEFTADDSQQVISRLRGAGIDAEQRNTQIVVPRRQEEQAIGLLVQDDLLSADTSQAFKELIDRQSPWQTDKQNEQAYLLAKQRVLGQVVGKMRGVRDANVLISMPRDQGFGATHVEPSASVTVWMESGQRVSGSMVDSVAQLVAGAVAEMSPQSVSVTDAHHGRTRTVRDDDAALPTDALEYLQHVEGKYQDKVNRVLGYIQGVIVAVNVRVDDLAREDSINWEYQENEPLRREEIEEQTRRDIRDGGEPGPRANTGATIAGGDGAGSEEQMTRQRSEFGEQPLLSERRITRAGRQVQQINVSINVPRGHFVQLYRANNPDAEAPTDEDLQPVVEQHLERIREQIEPLVVAEHEAVVRAHMVPDDTLEPAIAGAAPREGVGALLASDWVRPVGLGVLALVSLLLMLSLVRKASQREELPSVEELAGVPAGLDVGEEVVGDAYDTEGAMAGVELNEDELQTRRIAEQLNEMVKENPAEAGQLLSRWVKKG